jgi:hypothetical protein
MNQEFQELRRQFGINMEERSSIMQLMRENLIARNAGNPRYEFGYVVHGKVVDIASVDRPDELFEIDGDMCPRGL